MRNPGKHRPSRPTVAPRPASEGGSYVRQADGSTVRREFTHQLDDPEHEARLPPAPDTSATEPPKES